MILPNVSTGIRDEWVSLIDWWGRCCLREIDWVRDYVWETTDWESDTWLMCETVTGCVREWLDNGESETFTRKIYTWTIEVIRQSCLHCGVRYVLLWLQHFTRTFLMSINGGQLTITCIRNSMSKKNRYVYQ